MAEVRMASSQTLLVTRQRGRQVAAEMPRESELRLDFEGVEVASPSFLDELIKGIASNGTKKLVFFNVSERARNSLELLKRTHESSAAYPALMVE